MPKAQKKPLSEGLEKELGRLLMDSLVHGQGMNDFLHRFLKAAGSAFGVSRLVLYDFDETAGVFELLYFSGYPSGSRAELARRLRTMNMRRALEQPDPYWLEANARQLLVPLYFQTTLEAALVLEFDDCPQELDGSRVAACRVISRFMGLFLSSNRLPVNQKMRLLATTDLQRAREVQMAYLPSVHPVTDRYEIYGYNQSSALVGGDYFDYFRQRENSIQCIVADACGHGLAAALIMSTFRGLLHSEVRRIEGSAGLFTQLNQQLYVGGELLQYLTAVFFDYEEERGELRYFNAGHFDPLIIHENGTSTQLPGGGLPLGMFKDSGYEMKTSSVIPGDLLVVFTDGLVELCNARDEFFGVEGVLDSVLRRRHLPLKDLASEVLARAAQFSHDPQPADDLTLFLMRFT